ncbi:putative ribonuclease H-like domain-containing protein [Tanacetum coccineum]
MQEELLNKKDERGIVIRNKARLVAQGHRQEEEVYVTQPPRFKDLDHPDKVYKAVKALYGLHQAPRAWYETLANYLLSNGFKRDKIDQTLFIKKQKGDILVVQVYVDDIIFGSTNKELLQQKEDGIFISQDKYVAEILKKFNYSDVKSASTPVDLEKPLVKDGDADDVDVHLYRSMIRDSPFELVAYTDSDYAGATQDRKSTTRGCQFLGNRLISWQCKKQTIVATSTTEAKYVVKHVEYLMLNASPFEVMFEKKDNGLGSQCSGPRCQDTILGDVNAQTRFEITSKQSIDPPLSRGYTLGSGEDSMKLIGIDGILLKLVLLVFVYAVKHMLMLPVQVSAAEVNGVRQLQALVDKKRVIVMESSIRKDLHLDDAEGTDCLPTATIFEELERMGYEKPSQKLTFYIAFFSPQWKYFIHTIKQCLSAKSTTWNEFSSFMASLIICLATNQKFILSKYIFDAMVKHLDGGVKFLINPRFLQVFINQQLSNMSTHKKIFVNPFHTKKVFANMKRAGKDFSRRITPLFNTMMVQPVEEVGEGSDHLTNSTQIPIIDQPSSSSQPKKKQPSKKAQRQEADVPQNETEHEESVPTPFNNLQPSGEDSMQLTDLMVLDLEKAKSDQAIEIASLKKRVDKLEKRRQLRTTGLTRFKKFVLDDDEVFVDVASSEKNEQNTKLDDSTAGEAVTTASVEDSAASTIQVSTTGIGEVTTAKIDELTLAQTLIEIKAANPKVVTTAATTTTRPKGIGVVVQEPSEFRVPQESQPSISKDKGKAKLDAELEENSKLGGIARNKEEGS